jgi:hypothetical protein
MYRYVKPGRGAPVLAPVIENPDDNPESTPKTQPVHRSPAERLVSFQCSNRLAHRKKRVFGTTRCAALSGSILRDLKQPNGTGRFVRRRGRATRVSNQASCAQVTDMLFWKLWAEYSIPDGRNLAFGGAIYLIIPNLDTELFHISILKSTHDFLFSFSLRVHSSEARIPANKAVDRSMSTIVIDSVAGIPVLLISALLIVLLARKTR